MILPFHTKSVAHATNFIICALCMFVNIKIKLPEIIRKFNRIKSLILLALYRDHRLAVAYIADDRGNLIKQVLIRLGA